jgi:hypothetical protein
MGTCTQMERIEGKSPEDGGSMFPNNFIYILVHAVFSTQKKHISMFTTVGISNFKI